MKRLLQWLCFWKRRPQEQQTGFDIQGLKSYAAHKPAKQSHYGIHPLAANNGIYFGGTEQARPTWGDNDPVLGDILDRTIVDEALNFQGSDSSSQGSEDTFQGFGGGESEGGGASGSWDDGGSSSDSGSSNCSSGE